MANEPEGGGGPRGPSAGTELPQHPLVESLRPDPSQPAKKTVVLIGLPGKSDRPGYQRLYLTTKLNYYAEFLVSGILSAQTIPADKSPFPGHEATQVTIGRDANIQYISATSPQPVDEFDLDVRLGTPAAASASIGLPTRGPTCFADGTCRTCRTCDTCGAGTCQTCQTACGQATCQTCQTACGQATCGTCQTRCNQHTCGGTCVTCIQAGCGPTDVPTGCADFFTCPKGCGRGGGGDDTIGNLCVDVTQDCTQGCQ
jgi:hypothetical protein